MLPHAFAMIKTALFLRCALLGALLALPAHAGLEEETVSTFKADGIQRLDMAATNGRIQVEVWDREEVWIGATKSAETQPDMDAIQVEMARRDGAIKVKTQYRQRPKKGWFRTKMVTAQGSVDFLVKVPQRMRVDAETTNGSIEARGLEGGATLSSVNGSVRVENLGGKVRLTCVNGQIESLHTQTPRQAPVQIQAETVNGSVRIRSAVPATAQVELSSVNGERICDLPKPGAGEVPTFKISAKTVNGGIFITRE